MYRSDVDDIKTLKKGEINSIMHDLSIPTTAILNVKKRLLPI
jgi:hypothetical protein